MHRMKVVEIIKTARIPLLEGIENFAPFNLMHKLKRMRVINRIHYKAVG